MRRIAAASDVDCRKIEIGCEAVFKIDRGKRQGSAAVRDAVAKSGSENTAVLFLNGKIL